MSRSMIDANGRLFESLTKFCASRGVSLSRTDGYRYVEGDDDSDVIIQHFVILNVVKFGTQRAAVHGQLSGEDLIIFVGFENIDDYVNRYPEFGDDVEEVECLPGHIVTLLSEIDIRPNVSAHEVRSYVEVDDSTNKSYEGHDSRVLMGLYPRLAVFRCRSSIDQGSFAQLVTKFSAAESAFGGGWIGENLLLDLLAIASISARSFPYEAISRAVFDTDPRNLYLALYRCLEATYAYKTSEELAKALGLEIAWSELAVKLNESLSWRPREASSLEVVLRHASETDLRKVVTSLGNQVGADAAAAAASSVYKLRNKIVHFGPSLDSVDISTYDWNAVCCALVAVVYDVFHRAFDPAAV